jgi:hypothetical protein
MKGDVIVKAKSWFFQLIVVTLLASCGSRDAWCQKSVKEPWTLPYLPTSFFELFSHPDRFHNRIICITGFLRLGQEESRIYFSKEDAEFLRGENSLWVRFNDSVDLQQPDGRMIRRDMASVDRFNSQYVGLTGLFRDDQFGHLGGSFATIDSVWRIVHEARVEDATIWPGGK